MQPTCDFGQPGARLGFNDLCVCFARSLRKTLGGREGERVGKPGMILKGSRNGETRFHMLKPLMVRLKVKALMARMAFTTDNQSVLMTGSTGAIQMRALHMVGPSRSDA